MLLQDAFNALHDRHLEATGKGDIQTLREVSEQYDQLLNDAPEDIALLFSAATLKMQLGYNGLSIAMFEKCLKIQDLPEVWNNLGTAYKAENHNDKARECWLRALSMREDADYYNNMSTLYVNEGDPAPGLEFAERGLELSPDHPRLRWNRALLMLELGRWKEGFSEYDWGLKSIDRPNRMYSNDPDKIPMWSGKPGQKVVVYGEQGVGDEIMFASALGDLLDECEVVLDCHPRLVKLFERSFGIKCYGTRKTGVIQWPKDEHLDAKLPIGSLFKWFRADGEFPKTPYLTPDPYLVVKYRQRLEALGPGPYIGIGWRAGTKSTRQDLRSIKLKEFEPLIDHAGTFVSLQYSADSLSKVERYKAESNRVVHHWPEVVETGPDEENRYLGYDFDHTVALIEALDLVIVPNTTAVHVCGAIGKECWTITPSAPAWRYQLSGDQMPMYGSVRQFRGGDALERIVKEYRNRWPRAVSAVA